MTETLLLHGGIAGDSARHNQAPPVRNKGGVSVRRPAPHDDPRVSRSRRLLSRLFTLLLIVLLVFLWPAKLGGSTRLVIVSGHSMEPTYDFGDIVIARDGGRTDVGDVVVFEVPDGTAKGMLVIHRIIAVDDDGFFVTQGDNRDTADQWQLADDNIVGQPLLHVPKGGQAVWFLRQWTVLAVLIGLLTVVILWPSRAEHEDSDLNGNERDAVEPPPDVVDSLWPESPWSDTAIVRDVMAEANAWLDAQLDVAMHDAAAAVVAEPETAVQRIRAQVAATRKAS